MNEEEKDYSDEDIKRSPQFKASVRFDRQVQIIQDISRETSKKKK